MVLLYEGHLGDTIIAGNINLGVNIILVSIYLVPSYLLIGLHTSNEKYRISQSKTETLTNITFHEINERIEYFEMLEVTDDEGEMHLLIGLKYTVIVSDTVPPILTMPHSTSFFFCNNNVPIQYIGNHTPLYILRQGIFMYLNLFYK